MLNPRTLGLAAHHFSGVAVQLWRILRTLFHEVIGFIFLVLAAWGVFWLIRHVRQFDGEGELLLKIVVVGIFVLTMGSFGVTSFWKARRTSRGK